jgi:hypothetical protein
MPSLKIINPKGETSRTWFLIFSLVVLQSCSPVSGADPVPTPTEQPAAKYTATVEFFERYTVVAIDRKSFLAIYQDPTTDSHIIGQIPSFGTDILPTREIHQESEITWALISYGDTTGWVNMEYLAEQYGSLPDELIQMGQEVLEGLKTRQYGRLSPFIHPEFCLRFSPYSYLNQDNQKICPTELANLIDSEDPISWGQFDGTGKPINLTFSDYHQQFVYDQDYINPTIIGFDFEVSTGNAINNIKEIFPDGVMIEYHFPGIDPQYGGLDWRSLRLVFIPENGYWFLAAIIHGEWTI